MGSSEVLPELGGVYDSNDAVEVCGEGKVLVPLKVPRWSHVNCPFVKEISSHYRPSAEAISRQSRFYQGCFPLQ